MKNYQDIKWKKSNDIVIPAHLNDWLLYPGSFMQRLIAHGALAPRIEVRKQAWEFPEPCEKMLLNTKLSSQALIREVLILSENKKWMFARTVFPPETLTG